MDFGSAAVWNGFWICDDGIDFGSAAVLIRLCNGEGMGVNLDIVSSMIWI